MLRGKPEGIETKPGHISWNRCSGISAINVAWHLGAARAVLVGFDMRRVDKDDNWHDEHKKMNPNSYKKRDDDKAGQIYNRFMKCLPAVAKDAEGLGFEILNATPGSAIKQFKFVNLEDVANDAGAVAARACN